MLCLQYNLLTWLTDNVSSRIVSGPFYFLSERSMVNRFRVKARPLAIMEMNDLNSFSFFSGSRTGWATRVSKRTKQFIILRARQ